MTFYVNLFKESFPASLSSEVDLILSKCLFKSGFLENYQTIIEQYNNLNVMSGENIEFQAPVSKYDEIMEDKFSVVVEGNKISIPRRVYFCELIPITTNSFLTPLQKHMIACMLTRHCDGIVRDYFLTKIILLDESWVVPFVMELVGEYVSEILEVIYRNLPKMNLSLYQKFIKENPKHFQLIKARIMSYWDCYYRDAYPERENYVGFEILHYLETHP